MERAAGRDRDTIRIGWLKHVGGHGGDKVSADCCLQSQCLSEDLFVSINKVHGGH